MQSFGVVTEVNGTEAKVLFSRKSACGENCKMCGGCEEREFISTVKNQIGAKIGDKVKVETETKKLLGIVFLIYIVPLFLMAGAYALFGTIVAIITLFIGFLLAAMFGNKIIKKPFISEIMED